MHLTLYDRTLSEITAWHDVTAYDGTGSDILPSLGGGPLSFSSTNGVFFGSAMMEDDVYKAS